MKKVTLILLLAGTALHSAQESFYSDAFIRLAEWVGFGKHLIGLRGNPLKSSTQRPFANAQTETAPTPSAPTQEVADALLQEQNSALTADDFEITELEGFELLTLEEQALILALADSVDSQIPRERLRIFLLQNIQEILLTNRLQETRLPIPSAPTQEIADALLREQTKSAPAPSAPTQEVADALLREQGYYIDSESFSINNGF